MSFDELYESCFSNITLTSVPESKKSVSEMVSLDQVMSSSQFVVFYLTSGQSRKDVALRLDSMAKKRNERDKDKPQNSPARLRRLFSLKKKKKKRETGETSAVSVILFDTDHRSTIESSMSQAQPGWFVLSPNSPTTKSRLLRSLNFDVPPSVIVVDTASRSVVTTEGRRLLVEDPNGTAFPWWPPASSDLLKGPLVRRVGGKTQTTDYTEVKTTLRALFFGAFWCPPCRQWAKQLSSVYSSLRDKGISLEIIFCSSDRTQEFFDQFMDQMPWMAFAYDIAKTLALTRLYNISGIPSLILIDERGEVVSRHARSILLSDPSGSLFPWGPRPLYELDEHSVCRLRDEPSLILFTEGSPEDISFSMSVLDRISQRLFTERREIDERLREERERRQEERENSENGNSLSKSASSEECSSTNSVDVMVPPQADPLQILYTGEDPICDHILDKILGLEDAELPLICIVDGLAGQFAICEQPDISEEVLEEFVSDYRGGKLKWIPLPSAKDGNQTVAGIPSAMIEQALQVANSPSQNSIGKETV